MTITPAESRIMEALWERAPLSAEEIIEQVAEPQGWGAATVRTLIHRLLKRDALRSERIDGRTRYTPILARADYLRAESQNLLDRLFGGRLSPLVTHFVEGKALSSAKVEQLKALLAELEDDAG